MTETARRLLTKDRWAYGLFWSWNLIFLAFMTLGFAPRILPEMILAVGTAVIPAPFLLYALLLTLVPILAIILGLTLLRHAPARLFALGYVVEGPLMLLLAVRFFIIREATASFNLLMSIAGLGMAAFLWHVLDPAIEKRRPLTGWLRLTGLTLMLLASLYAAVWVAFYAAPLAVSAASFLGDTLVDLPNFIKGLADSTAQLFRERLVWVPFMVLGLALILYTGTLFVLTPLAVPWLSLRAWWRTLSGLAARHGWLRPTALAALTLVACAGLFVQANRQPQHRAFALLEAPPASLEDARALLGQQDSIRAGLLNAYLAPFRYISAVGEVFHVRWIYQDVFDLSEVEAAGVQRLYENVARPLLYDPVHSPQAILRQDNIALQREPQEAAELYQRFFDQTIVEGERQAIVRAVRATWSFEQAEAAWQAVDDREVYLVRQVVNVHAQDDWAEVELHEVYRNLTAERREVIYYFNLPESAVLTGVWLGNSPDREARFVYQVAPRGAAQAVYRNETRRNRDPALLEQIGPRQYRLRIFPVPPVRTTWDAQRGHTRVEEAPPLYMWMTYHTLAAGDAWPLPRLALKRNVYWDSQTERLVNGVRTAVGEDRWLPEAVAAEEPVVPQGHRVDLPGGESVLALPVSQVQLPPLPADLHFAVVLDRSRSMASSAAQVAGALAQLQEAVGVEAAVDVYLTASPYRGESASRVSLLDLDPQAVVYFGGQNAAELLAQFEALRAGAVYDAVLVFTDDSGYELGENTIDFSIPTAPVWMIHEGSDLPLGYDDQTLEAIQASGGGVVGELDQALARLAVALAEGAARRDVLDGYLWTVLPTVQADALAEGITPEEAFTAFGARQLILAEMQRQRGRLDKLSTLDRLHALAQEYGVVTPYSSMIVLVTTDQQQMLDYLAQGSQRFAREFETLGDTTPSTPLPLAGVPEPHEWLLLGLAVAMLLWYASKHRFSWDHS